MNNDFENENKKVKEIKETTEQESYENEDEAMENSAEGSGVEEELPSEICMPPYITSTHSYSSQTQSELEKIKLDARHQRMKELFREKWLTVTGKRPLSLPTIKPEIKKIEFFGDRRPAYIEKARNEKWMKLIADSVYKRGAVNYGTIVKEVRIPYNLGKPWQSKLHPQLKYIAISYGSGNIQVLHFSTLAVKWLLRTSENALKFSTRALSFYPLDFNKLYAGGSDGFLHVFDLETGATVGFSHHMTQLNTVEFSANCSYLVTGGANGILCIIDPSTLKLISGKVRPNITPLTTSAIDQEYHKSRVYGIKCHKTEVNLFVTGGWDRTVKIWDVRIPGAIYSIDGPFVSGESLDLNRNTILTASCVSENSVQLWDFPTGRLIRNVPVTPNATRFNGEFLTCAQFVRFQAGSDISDPQVFAVGGSGFNEISVLRNPTGSVLASFPAYKPVGFLDTQGGYICYGGRESLLRVGEIYLPNNNDT